MAEAPFRTEFFDKLFEWHVLVCITSQRDLFHSAEQSAETWIARNIGAQHQSIGEEPDHLFDFCAIAIGNRRADDNVVLIAVTRQQCLESRQQSHE